MIKFIVTALLILVGFVCKMMSFESKNEVAVPTLTELILKK
ncbi:MAG: hypothetical protein ABIP27_15490 [Flavobacterium circumlabens]|uniref:Uncharacterized protein n=1 Tax=Flavobacterium circumlabens TaxID=2133765 RepID=A0ABY2B498_9FLAO|nr:hypothetical protein [Flavobacterium circumlabens]TCN60867.1 hypothetical protein EV142_101446 [Flavobacterium circumlabens]